MACGGCQKRAAEFKRLKNIAVNTKARTENLENRIDKPFAPLPLNPQAEERFKGMNPRQVKIILRSERIQRRNERIRIRNENAKAAKDLEEQRKLEPQKPPEEIK